MGRVGTICFFAFSIKLARSAPSKIKKLIDFKQLSSPLMISNELIQYADAVRELFVAGGVTWILPL